MHNLDDGRSVQVDRLETNDRDIECTRIDLNVSTWFLFSLFSIFFLFFFFFLLESFLFVKRHERNTHYMCVCVKCSDVAGSKA